MAKRKTASQRMCEDVMILFASMVLTEPLVNAKQMRLAQRIAAQAKRLAARKDERKDRHG